MTRQEVYEVRGPQGRMERYLVNLRVNADLSLSPSADTFLTPVVWSSAGPYGAMSAAIVWAKAQGLELRHVFGVVEWPRSSEEEMEAQP